MPALDEASRALIRAARTEGAPTAADRERIGAAIERLLEWSQLGWPLVERRERDAS